jgi:hypothetical protein
MILIRAWEAVSMDAVTGTDQTGKRYWQCIEDKFFQLMPPLSTTPICSYRSLQGRWDTIKLRDTLLEHNPKWKLREQEESPPKHKLIEFGGCGG